MTIVYVNGTYVKRRDATIGAEDRAASFSDAIYEVVLIKHGIMIDENEHQERLERSLAGLSIPQPMGWNAMRQIIKRLLRVNGLLKSDASLYLQISRGEAKRDHAFPQYVSPSIFMMVNRVKPLSNAVYQKGVKAITAEDIRWLKRDIKTTSLLPNVLAKQQAVEAGVVEAILIEQDGTVTEGSATNVFMVNAKGELQTHPADNHILGGITRQGVIEVAKQQGVIVKEERFNVQALRDAKEIFITSTTKHILAVTTLDGQAVGDGKLGKVTGQLMAAYEDYVEKQWRKKCSKR